MNKITSFLRDKGFYLALLACILAAAISSFWAIRNMVQRLDATDPQTPLQEETIPWEVPQTQVDQKVEDIPKPASSAPQQAASSSQAVSPQPPAALEESGDTAEQAGVSFVQPVSGPISKEYSGDELVYSETLGDWRTHNGVDISCADDATVRACAAGTVTAVYEDGNWGQVVEVESDEVVYRYAGLAPDLAVAVGDELRAGAKLGMIGEISAESAEKTHLHFEVLKGGNTVDPMPYLAG